MTATTARAAAIYFVSAGMMFADQDRAERGIAELEKFFGAPLTSEAADGRFFAGRKCDRKFWRELADTASGMKKEYLPLLDHGPDPLELADPTADRLPPECLRRWKTFFRTSAKLKQFEERFDEPLPAAPRDGTAPIFSDFPDQRLADDLACCELWRIRFAVGDRDVPSALTALRRMEIARSYLAHDDMAFRDEFLICKRWFAALEQLLGAGLLSDAELLRLRQIADARRNELARRERRILWAAAVDWQNCWNADSFCGRVKYRWTGPVSRKLFRRPKVCRRDSDALYPYRWLFPPFWYRHVHVRAAAAEVFRAKMSAERADEFGYFGHDSFIALQAAGLIRRGKMAAELRSRYALMYELIGIELEKRRTGRYPDTLKTPLFDSAGGPVRFIRGEFPVRLREWKSNGEMKTVDRRVSGICLQSADGRVSVKLILPDPDGMSADR